MLEYAAVMLGAVALDALTLLRDRALRGVMLVTHCPVSAVVDRARQTHVKTSYGSSSQIEE